MQSSKVIDVSRSFIPVDVNAYPENLHGTDKEDSPERRIPVIPYAGYNFMPTGYGYRSYFGMNESLDVATLSPNKVNEILLYQTSNLKNILIALCDTGIWACNASVGGVWTQLVVKAAPAVDVFFEYTYEVINNKLYIFRSNDTSFYEINTDLGAALFISVTARVPAFITAASQLGMFRLGARLGFWDGANAIAWSSADDYTAFTPAVLTGANVTTFNSVIGKISAIRPHGKGVIVYGTRSVVLLAVEPNETFMVRAIPILNNAGVAYLRQSVSATPDTLHFCYTNIGIYKIENGKEELIVPEVFDFFKEKATNPIYLKLMQGRHLFFETMDEDVIAGSAQFSNSIIPASTLTFPAMGGSLAAVDAGTPATVNVCDVTGLLSDGYFDEQQAAADLVVPRANRKPGTLMQPRYTCYISNNGVKDVDNITYDNTPCGFTGPNGTPFLMSPNVPNNSNLTTDATNKTVSTGAAAYIDGKWTMQRFVQTQSAIWKAEEKVLTAVLAEILSRVYSETKQTEVNPCVAVPLANSDCDLGVFPASFSQYQFGFNACSFWLTRYALTAKTITARHTTQTSCGAVPNETFSLWRIEGHDWGIITSGYNYASAAAAAADAELAYRGVFNEPPNPDSRGVYFLSDILATSPGGAILSYNVRATIGGGVVCRVNRTVTTTTYTKTETGSAANIGVDTIITPTPESAFCLLTHWTYTDLNGVEQTIAATACTNTADSYPGSSTAIRQVPNGEGRDDETDDDTGAFCGAPFEYNTEFDVEWLDQTITYPESSFLLQVGSIAPKYPTMEGAYVYDLHLKKWGKMLGEYKQLLDYAPLNHLSANVINFDIFGILAGAVKADGKVYIFTDQPTDSRITWGKIGYYRAGMTDPEEVRVDFRKLSTGSVIVQGSIDGKNLGDELITTEEFESANTVICYPLYAGKWHNVTVTGKYDICYLEFKGLQKGRR